MLNRGLTVIIPIYNDEKYLIDCLESITKQTLKELEILLINDGSTDGSKRICNLYAEKDQRIKVINQINTGLVAARKKGIINATMPYITFVDSDDWLDLTLLKDLYQELDEETDLVTSGLCYEQRTAKREEYDCFMEGTYIKEKIKSEIIPQMMFYYSKEVPGILQSVCGKIFKTDKLLGLINQLDEKVTIGEDGTIVYPYILNSNQICITKECGYHYRQHNSSMVHSIGFNVFEKIKLLQLYYYQNLLIDNRLLKNQIDKNIKRYLRMNIESEYHLTYREEQFSFQFSESIPDESKVVIYGAGNKGCALYEWILKKQKWKVVLWVDQNYENMKNYYVDSPDLIKAVEYDYIFIAIENINIVKSVENFLIQKGIPEKKIKKEIKWIYF